MKTEVGAKSFLYPMPITLVGTLVNGKPNYITIVHVGIMDQGTVSLGMSKVHYTNAGIKENGTFSVNIPSTKLVRETDCCGLVSGKSLDKVALFRTFYGKLKTAPMIEECAVNMDCRLTETVDFPNHDVFMGQITATYCDEALLTGGTVDFSKVQPVLFVMNDRSYWMLGKKFAKAWNIGNKLKITK
jgi:flavin reductase (DIM6/NTAB) family NADH-FMN oxidoreductase RutF